jgi:hypothetical protein
MNLKKLVPTVLVGILALTAVFGIAANQPVQASSSAAAAVTTQANVALGRGVQGDVNETELAAALGVTAEQLSAARTTANAEALKQAVAKGLITQAQADQVTANGGGRMDFGLFAQNGIDENALLANALGITPEKLAAAFQTAFTAGIDKAVTAGTLTQAQADMMKARYALSNSAKFQSALQTAYQAAVQQAVTDGAITQAQADAILKDNATPGMGFDLGGRGGKGGPGGHMEGGPGMNGGGRGGRGGNPLAPTTPQTQPTPGSGA